MSNEAINASLGLLTLGANAVSARVTVRDGDAASAPAKTDKDGQSFSSHMKNARRKLDDNDAEVNESMANAAISTPADNAQNAENVDAPDEITDENAAAADMPVQDGGISAYRSFLNALTMQESFTDGQGGNADTAAQAEMNQAIIEGLVTGGAELNEAANAILEQYKQNELTFDEMVQALYREATGEELLPVTKEIPQAEIIVSQDAKQVAALSDQTQAGESNEAERTVSLLQTVAEHVSTVEAGDNADNRFTKSDDGEGQNDPTQLGAALQGNANQTPTISVNDYAPDAAAEAPLPDTAAQDIMNGMLEQIETAVTDDRSEMFIQLKPEVLGGLALRLSMTEDGLSAQVRASSQNVQSVINSQLTQLEDALRARGIEVVNIDVVYEQMANQQQMSEQRQQWHGEGGGGTRQSTYRHVEEIDGLASAENVYETMGAAADEDGQEGVVYSA